MRSDQKFPDGVKRCTSPEADLTTVDEKVKTSDGLAIDWVHQLLFCADGAEHKIVVWDLRKMLKRDLITAIRDPRSVAVDPGMGLLFWINAIEKRIERSGMDGGDRAVRAGFKV